MNNVSLIGRLTAVPELKYTQSNTAYTRFSIAVDRPVKQGEEKQADFINIVAWSKTAEFICKYFTKGQRIALTGSVRTGSYTDRNGIKHYTFDVWANNVEFRCRIHSLYHSRLQTAVNTVIYRPKKICRSDMVVNEVEELIHT